MIHIATLQPEETEEDRVAHENLKKVKASERSVVAMQAKYKVRANTNTNANASQIQGWYKYKYSAKYKVCKKYTQGVKPFRLLIQSLYHAECDNGKVPKEKKEEIANVLSFFQEYFEKTGIFDSRGFGFFGVTFC